MTISAKDLKIGDVLIMNDAREYEIDGLTFSKSGKMITVDFIDNYSASIGLYNGQTDYRISTKLTIKNK
tara:strand:+ start:155 stop:361 length:207 start_codon:yes stop_codon:yes gene_type:complete